ncbi:MAG: sulfite exporter TauE/SafE family protein [Clostridia bacterium]|nr:sulfite exporter TauE/SafE family protein [Clostridia bacterium]
MTVLFVFFGLIGGFFGGMGMGGGTFLIPLLTIIGGLEQHLSQTINLIAFIPTSFIALIFHVKNGYVEVKDALFLLIPAAVFTVIGAFAARGTDGALLRKIFGAFLVFLSVRGFLSRKKENQLFKSRNRKDNF